MKKLALKILNHHNKKELSTFDVVIILFCFAVLLLSLVLVYGVNKSSARDKNIVVVIDPGHGGNDPGKVSGDNILEKDINLQISFRLKHQLEEKGITVIMTREEDVNLATAGATNKKSSDMKNRVALVNDNDATCLISIHQNSYTDSSVRGGQTFYYGESEESKQLALEIQGNIKEIDSKNHREAKTGNDYYILNKSICPGVIVECGFLSCPEETVMLVSEEYQEKLAQAITDAICTVYDN